MDKIEETTSFGICRCCLLDTGIFKGLWAEYVWEDQKEIYGEMLIECFALSWQHPDKSSEHIEQICETCVERLRDAFNFKKQVLTSEMQLLEQFEKENKFKIIQLEKNESTDDCITLENQEDEHIKREYDNNHHIQDMKDGGQIEIMVTENGDDHDSQDFTGDEQDENMVTEYDDSQTASVKEMENDETDNVIEYEVEYLEIECEKQESSIDVVATNSPATQSEPVKRKWPKKRKKGDRIKIYKKYSADDLRQCLEDIKNKKKTKIEAALFYNVPKKTLDAKLGGYYNVKKIETPEDEIRQQNQERHLEFIEEIKTILMYTSAIPYKTKSTRYYCAYCGTDGSYFEDADDLRTHTLAQHEAERIKGIDEIMRPRWLNEMIKFEITNLHCTECQTALPKWNNMFDHLNEAHGVQLDQAYTKVVPYVLKNELNCALCDQWFPHYSHLDVHMNAHYNNYICYECGDSFLTQHRLDKHLKIHSTSKFPCDACGKVFTLDKYRKKHMDLVHKQADKIKCLYCDARFHGTYPRHLHVLKEHKEKVKFITCELCGQCFDWHPYYMSHMRRKHEKERNYTCDACGKEFFMICELKKHLLTHTGEKNFVCKVCDKRYTTKWALLNHGKSHGQETPPSMRVKRKDLT